MLHSMTGYGRGEAHNAEVAVVVELRSKNNRFRDIQLRSPRDYAALDGRVTEVLKQSFARGRVDATIHRTAQGAATVRVDLALARRFAAAFDELATAMSLDRDPGVLGLVLQQPGVLVVDEGDVDAAAEWDIVQAALSSAVEALGRMRRTEGEALQGQLEGCLDQLESHVEDVRSETRGLAERVKDRIERRLASLTIDHDPQRVAQEVALLAEKADIDEELVRLHSHVQQFREALGSTEPVGRRLEFLLQEMNREANTIGSKAVEVAVSQRVVDMKSELERMREQAANVQ